MKKLVTLFILFVFTFINVNTWNAVDFKINTTISTQKQQAYIKQVDWLMKWFDKNLSNLSEEKQKQTINNIISKLNILLLNKKISENNKFLLSYLKHTLNERLLNLWEKLDDIDITEILKIDEKVIKNDTSSNNKKVTKMTEVSKSEVMFEKWENYSWLKYFFYTPEYTNNGFNNNIFEKYFSQKKENYDYFLTNDSKVINEIIAIMDSYKWNRILKINWVYWEWHYYTDRGWFVHNNYDKWIINYSNEAVKWDWGAIYKTSKEYVDKNKLFYLSANNEISDKLFNLTDFSQMEKQILSYYVVLNENNSQALIYKWYSDIKITPVNTIESVTYYEQCEKYWNVFTGFKKCIDSCSVWSLFSDIIWDNKPKTTNDKCSKILEKNNN